MDMLRTSLGMWDDANLSHQNAKKGNIGLELKKTKQKQLGKCVLST